MEGRHHRLVGWLALGSFSVLATQGHPAPRLTTETIEVHSPDGFAMEPTGICELPNGDFVITVARHDSAWIARVNKNGFILWQKSIQEIPTQNSGPRLFRPVLRANGLIEVVGCLPRDFQGLYTEVVFIRFDGQGNEVRRISSPLFPRNGRVSLGPYVDSYSGGDRYGSLGIATQVVRFGAPTVLPIVKHYFWLGALNELGELIECFIPGVTVEAAYSGGLFLRPLAENWLIVATDNQVTQMMLVTASGQILAQSSLQGRYLPVVNEESKESFELVGGEPPHNVGQLKEFNEHLDQIFSRERSGNDAFSPVMVARDPKGTFIMVGNSTHLLGASVRPGVILARADLKELQSQDLSASRRFAETIILGASLGARPCSLLALRPLGSMDAQGSSRVPQNGLRIDRVELAETP